MDEFTVKIEELKKKIIENKEYIKTEESTKTAMVLPLLRILGYDDSDPLEVIPEFVADISTKKGEKVDYCIQKEGRPIIIIECKHWKENLDLHSTQLERYFNFTDAKFGVLTNGIKYRFYTELEEKNKMDNEPFFEFDITDFKETDLIELKKFAKDKFDLDKILSSASELKHLNAIKIAFKEELKEPSDEFIRHLAIHTYKGRFTEKVLNQFKPIVKKAVNSIINEIINERLQAALSNETEKQKEEDEIEEDPFNKVIYKDEERGIYTTEAELNAYQIVKDILIDILPPERIFYRDSKTYFSILLDDTNRMPICKLRLDKKNKYLTLINKKENKEKNVRIEKLEHIYKYAGEIENTVKWYLKNLSE